MMNSFIDSILELLLSWVRGIINDIWSIFSGDSVSIFAWLSQHWLILTILLILFGVILDLFIYLLRWQPQRVWLSRFDRIFRKPTEEETAFNDGYEMGIESFELDSDPVISEYINTAPTLEQFDAGITPESASPQMAIDVLPDSGQPVRRRRSDRHNHKNSHRRLISIKLPSLESTEAPFTAYPAPPVQAREAFHDAVYPSDNQPLWQQSANNNHANQ